MTARRSAGTETGLDVLLRWTWIRRRTPAQDIEDFKKGQPLQVVGFTKTIGGAAMGVGRSWQVDRTAQVGIRAPGRGGGAGLERPAGKQERDLEAAHRHQAHR
ncbi:MULTISPECIES: hypothetical protein [unclassified Streptomyces]|uniref:hypothetical protein n=1 Tax=unclassified Streptomyces TaxID=2593676 RepID=UPI002E358218|nr:MULTISPECIES: hypothetical protein [unclassified Streptomyces]